MTGNKQNSKIIAEHSKMEGLIPWYVNNTLPASERSVMEQHIAECELCQKEQLSCQSLVENLPTPVEVWKPSSAHFAGILSQVDCLEEAANNSNIRSKKAASVFFPQIGDWFSRTPRQVRWLLAFETMAFAVLALFLVLPQQTLTGSKNVYETLSNDESKLASGKSIRLVFAEDMTTRELSDLLNQVKAQIRQGPSEIGSYTVEVMTQNAEQSLSELRNYPKVRLAQLIE